LHYAAMRHGSVDFHIFHICWDGMPQVGCMLDGRQKNVLLDTQLSSRSQCFDGSTSFITETSQPLSPVEVNCSPRQKPSAPTPPGRSPMAVLKSTLLRTYLCTTQPARCNTRLEPST